MPPLQTPEERGRLVLGIYAHFDSLPGHVLRATNLVAVAKRRRIPIADVQRGLEYAAQTGWIEKTENGSLRLTERGFAEMPRPDRSH